MKRFVTILCFFLPGLLTAQYKIYLTAADAVPGDYTYTDSVQINTQVLITTNTDIPVDAIGNVRYYIQTDSMFLSSQPPRLIDHSVSDVFVSASTGYADFFKLDLQPYEMRSGPINVVIVWPSFVSTSFPISDSLFRLVNVALISTVSLDPVASTIYHQLKPFPNPTTGLLQFPDEAKTNIQHLRISDVSGTVWKEQQSAIINLQDLPNGIYWIHVFWNNGNTSFYPVIKKSD